jgi:hypothetical protein
VYKASDRAIAAVLADEREERERQNRERQDRERQDRERQDRERQDRERQEREDRAQEERKRQKSERRERKQQERERQEVERNERAREERAREGRAREERARQEDETIVKDRKKKKKKDQKKKNKKKKKKLLQRDDSEAERRNVEGDEFHGVENERGEEKKRRLELDDSPEYQAKKKSRPVHVPAEVVPTSKEDDEDEDDEDEDDEDKINKGDDERTTMMTAKLLDERKSENSEKRTEEIEEEESDAEGGDDEEVNDSGGGITRADDERNVDRDVNRSVSALTGNEVDVVRDLDGNRIYRDDGTPFSLEDQGLVPLMTLDELDQWCQTFEPTAFVNYLLFGCKFALMKTKAETVQQVPYFRFFVQSFVAIRDVWKTGGDPSTLDKFDSLYGQYYRWSLVRTDPLDLVVALLPEYQGRKTSVIASAVSGKFARKKPVLAVSGQSRSLDVVKENNNEEHDGSMRATSMGQVCLEK